LRFKWFNTEPRDSPNEPPASPPGGFPSAFNRGSPIEPSIEMVPRVHTRTSGARGSKGPFCWRTYLRLGVAFAVALLSQREFDLQLLPLQAAVIRHSALVVLRLRRVQLCLVHALRPQQVQPLRAIPAMIDDAPGWMRSHTPRQCAGSRLHRRRRGHDVHVAAPRRSFSPPPQCVLVVEWTLILGLDRGVLGGPGLFSSPQRHCGGETVVRDR